MARDSGGGRGGFEPADEAAAGIKAGTLVQGGEQAGIVSIEIEPDPDIIQAAGKRAMELSRHDRMEDRPGDVAEGVVPWCFCGDREPITLAGTGEEARQRLAFDVAGDDAQLVCELGPEVGAGAFIVVTDLGGGHEQGERASRPPVAGQRMLAQAVAYRRSDFASIAWRQAMLKQEAGHSWVCR